MASIYKRRLKDGSGHYRMVIRRKELPLFSLTFTTREEAKAWVKENEANYIEMPMAYHKWARENRLSMKRAREFRDV